jgi:hypothetical protein
MFGTASCPHCGYRPPWFLGPRCVWCGKYTFKPAWKLALAVLLIGWLGAALLGLIVCWTK